MSLPHFDVVIIGGGINGVGIAADAAGRGLAVALCEKSDLAQATSSASSKLIHGGLRYLETYEFGLVRAALREREILLKKAPHLIHPLQFILPHASGMRPAWLLRLGLRIYDYLARTESLPKSQAVTLCADSPFAEPLRSEFTRGFSYYDAWVDDARLVVANALHASQHGAQIMTHNKLIQAEVHNHQWHLTLEHSHGHRQLTATALINAAGPWVNEVNKLLGLDTTIGVRLVKGSHIILPKRYCGEQAYLLQNHDNRVLFVIPYHDNYVTVGTTEIAFQGDPLNATISDEEVTYLLQSINRYLRIPYTASDIVWSYSGVRPLQYSENTNLSSISRDYKLQLILDKGAPLLNIFGGKITTYRTLAQEALKKLSTIFPNYQTTWTAAQPLPGGDLPDGNFATFFALLKNQYRFLDDELLHRYARIYGTRTHELLQNVVKPEDLGTQFAGHLTAREVEFLQKTEWATTADDILWRRTKVGLHMNESEKMHFKNWFAKQNPQR